MLFVHSVIPVKKKKYQDCSCLFSEVCVRVHVCVCVEGCMSYLTGALPYDPEHLNPVSLAWEMDCIFMFFLGSFQG